MSETPPVSASGRSALEVARQCAVEAGHIAVRSFRKPHDMTTKGRGNWVTESDLAMEARIHEILRSEYPAHAILSEETASDTPTDGWVWVVDPLDGTANYSRGVSLFCVNVALCLDGRPIVAVTHEPCGGETFYAQLGRGAFVNDTPIHCSARASVEDSIVAFDLGYHGERGSEMLSVMCDIFPAMQAARIPGSAALGLAYSAAGRYDLFVHNRLYPWDIAPAILLVREAGGTITDRTGGMIGIRSRTVIAGGTLVHDDFLRLQSERGWQPPAA